MKRTIASFVAALMLFSSNGVQAETEIVPPLVSWCVGLFDGWVVAVGGKRCGYPTEMEAAQAAAAAYSIVYAPNKATIISCNGKGQCSYIVTFSSGNTQTGDGWNVLIHYDGCQVPSVNPDVPYSFNMVTHMCQREVQANLSITLTGGETIEPRTATSASVLPFIATVVDLKTGLPPTTPVAVKISLKVDSTSGGHDHGDSTRPRGGIDSTKCEFDATCKSFTTGGSGSDGRVSFTFNPADASGTHTVTATCDRCGNPASKAVDVKVAELEPIPASAFYTFIGKTDKHQDNHYLTPDAAKVLWQIAASYQFEQQFKLKDPATGKFTVTPPVLHVNDASLVWGGLFDIYGKWMSPHFEHRRGTVVDIRANTLPTAIPEGNLDEFMLLSVYYGADAFLETPSAALRHFHLRLLNREE